MESESPNSPPVDEEKRSDEEAIEIENENEKESSVGDEPKIQRKGSFSDSDSDDDDSVDPFEPVLVGLDDHFSLPSHSCLVRSRKKSNAVRVYNPGFSTQLVIEEFKTKDNKTQIEVKKMNDVTSGHQLLNALYTIVCALFAGFLFVFCLQILLFLVLDLSIASGATETSDGLHMGNVLGVLFAIIAFSHYFAEALVIAGALMYEAWSDHPLSKTFILPNVSEGDVIIEWVFLGLFLLVPAFVGIVTLFMGLADWWWYTTITWFTGILIFYVVFAGHVVFYEVRSAFAFVANRDDTDSDAFWDVIHRCILLRQRRYYGGNTTSTYLARNVFSESEDTDKVQKSKIYDKSKSTRFSLWTYVTKLLPGMFFEKLEEPQPIYTTPDVEDYRPFLTRSNWSLERIFCRPANSRYITIVSGPGALTQGQLKSTVACSILGGSIILISVAAFLTWMGANWQIVLFFLAIVLLLCYRPLKNAYDLIQLGKDLIKVQKAKERKYFNYWGGDSVKGVVEDEEKTEEKDTEAPMEIGQSGRASGGRQSRRSSVAWAGEKGTTKPSEAVYLVTKTERVSEATELFCWISFIGEQGLFFLWPTITLIIINRNLGLLFLACSLVSNTRWYINAVTAIEETGNMDLVNGDTPLEKWENKARLNDIVNNISTSEKRYKFWRGSLASLGFLFIAMMLSTSGGDGVVQSQKKPFTYLPEQYYYPPAPEDMLYPTCTFANLEGGFGNRSTMLDYAWFARTAYRPVNNITEFDLDKWFEFTGDDVRDEQPIVDRFLDDPNYPNRNDFAVTFKLISVPGPVEGNRTAIILIRGTVNQWDALADAQLWSAAALMQWLRYIIPVGELWTPIFGELVRWMNALAKTSLDKIAFYKLTTEFAEHVKLIPDFAFVQVTGHSLGGGLSLITGAQAKIPAIGLSAPNALISGKSFTPEVTEDDLNKYGFNIIPNQDIVPKLDDVAANYQPIRCTRPVQTGFGECHFGFQSVCEIQTTCGSGNRPVICECYTDALYGKPLVKDGFEDEFDKLCGITD